MGLEPIKKPIQMDSIDEELRNTLWSMLTIYYWDTYRLIQTTVASSRKAIYMIYSS